MQASLLHVHEAEHVPVVYKLRVKSPVCSMGFFDAPVTPVFQGWGLSLLHAEVQAHAYKCTHAHTDSLFLSLFSLSLSHVHSLSVSLSHMQTQPSQPETLTKQPVHSFSDFYISP